MSRVRPVRRAPRLVVRRMLTRVFNLFSCVWFGVVLALALLVYCSIGSAVPAVRQHPKLEMTEFQWFHWWPFHALIILFTITMVVSTIRRIPLRLTNAGVWTIHTGIVMLTLGSYIYFGAKLEGDAPVFRRRVRIELPGLASPQALVALPGNEARVIVGPDAWSFRVQGTNSAWPILSDEHAGKTAYAVNVAVTPPAGQPFVRQLLAGYEQYTEDVIPGQGRAIKSIGRKLVDETLKLSLEYEPQSYFHLMDTWALYVRRPGQEEWVQRRIPNLPRYHDRVASRDQVFLDDYPELPLRSLDLPVPRAGNGADPLSDRSLRITGYLRYAQQQRRWRDGGARLNPVCRYTLIHAGSSTESQELMAFDRSGSMDESGLVQFSWHGSAESVGELPTGARPLLRIEVPSSSLARDVTLSPEQISGPDGPFTPLEGTEFSYRIRGLQDHLTLPGQSRPVSIALVEIRFGDKSFRRWVADVSEFTRDIHGEGTDPHSLDTREPDPRIVMSYRPQSPPLLLAAFPGGARLIFNGPEERMFDQPISPGTLVEIMGGLKFRLDDLKSHAVAEVRPYVVPPHRRDRDARENFSMIRLEMDTGRGVEARWIPFQSYVFANDQYAYPGRFVHTPVPFALADGSTVEVVFSRERHLLPAPVVLDGFDLDTHIGGYSGAVSTIRNYLSHLRFRDGTDWSGLHTIAVNHPTQFGGFWYFQSMWDRPPPGDANGGMNYTGLGVGNRRGVYVQLAGCCLAVVGMIFAFYVKPVIVRRMRTTAQFAALSSPPDLTPSVAELHGERFETGEALLTGAESSPDASVRDDDWAGNGRQRGV